MTSWSTFLTLVAGILSVHWVQSTWKQTIEPCGYDLGEVHKGTLQKSKVEIYGTKKHMRSKVECAAYCYADFYCRSAIYQHDGDCMMVASFIDSLIITDEGNEGTEEVIEMKVRSKEESRGKSAQDLKDMKVILDCSVTCSGTSVCTAECGDGSHRESGCVETATTQYGNGCEFEPYIYSVEYVLKNLNVESNVNGHEFFAVTYTKLQSWTILRVKWRGTLRGGFGNTGSWGRWQILFNGNHCADPGWIESINYNAEADTNHHKTTGIHGICNDLPSGSYSISLRAELHSSTFRVGYATKNSWLYVDELGQRTFTGEPTVASCPTLPLFNMREYISYGSWGNDRLTTLWNFDYTKMEVSTWLRINVDIVLRIHPAGANVHGCATWYIKIDGNNCSPQPLGISVANLDYANQVNNEHRSTEFEGHCEGVSAGLHTLSLYIDTCPFGEPTEDAYTGLYSCRQRIIVEEFRKSTNLVGAAAADGTMYRMPQFNIESFSFANLNQAADEDIVWSLPNYHKIYATSGLRVALSADGRVYNGHQDSSYDSCCRHYFKINDAECDTPGTIEGIHSINKWTNLHRPIMVEGTCQSVNAGVVTLSVAAGICWDHTKVGDCHFGWNSYGHVMVSETFSETIIQTY